MPAISGVQCQVQKQDLKHQYQLINIMDYLLLFFLFFQQFYPYLHCDEFQTEGTDKIAERIKKRVGDNPLYLSIDIDVLDPAFAPGTGTPEIAGMTTREMVNVIRGLSGMNLISADVVEVSPAYDHAEVTSLAAATIVYELTNLFAKK